MRCDRCGRQDRQAVVTQTNYGLSRRPRQAVTCQLCLAEAVQAEAPRKLAREIEALLVLDAASAQAGMTVEQRDQLFKSSGYADAFAALMQEVS